MSSLTVVTLTLNEERNIEACLEGVRWADQIIVVDACSTDKTVALAGKYTRDIFTRPWEGYGPAKNFALQQARGDWILWLDADERVTEELAGEIRQVVQREEREFSAFAVARRAYFLGRWIRHCGWYPGRVIRLFRKEKGRFTESQVHEGVVVDGPVGLLAHDLLHHTDTDLAHYFWKFNRYTTLAANDMHTQGRRAGVADLVFRPPFMFFKMYVVRLGFLDGIHGFILSAVSSAYVFVKYAKLWERFRNPS